MEPATKILQVDLGERSYPIYIGSGLLSDPALYQRHISGQQVMVVSNETIAPLYLEQVLAALGSYQTASVILPDGEKFKTIEIWNTIFDALLEQHFDRRCTILALGGGVVGDMAGFAASAYQRGVHFIQVPTTLLAQVDSSVGGKTGVNHPKGKNMVGAFYQPRCVIADMDTITTLDDRQLAAGLAEVIKYGLINDPDFFTWLEQNIDALLGRDPGALSHAIERSCQNKAQIVAADEKEVGQRALLNLGHTFGHAIETGVGYGGWLHGEAVGAGICMAADLSQRLGWLTEKEKTRIEDIISNAKLPTTPPIDLSPELLLKAMTVDKKVLDGQLRLILLKGIGQSFITDNFNHSDLLATLNEYGRNN
ncbi:3-dehydroquinate synthase [hydrothermal vent metagenome]|uniref:3-dehydroquinate synthase n=1 Tax=hydrothermal vent metagenome TaxID=652676 RepID=A0A3B1BG90_9ZZZZ